MVLSTRVQLKPSRARRTVQTCAACTPHATAPEPEHQHNCVPFRTQLYTVGSILYIYIYGICYTFSVPPTVRVCECFHAMIFPQHTRARKYQQQQRQRKSSAHAGTCAIGWQPNRFSHATPCVLKRTPARCGQHKPAERGWWWVECGWMVLEPRRRICGGVATGR